MKAFFKEYFNYSKREIRGIIVLIVLILLVFTIPIIVNFNTSGDNNDFTEFESQLDNFETEIKIKTTQKISTTNKITYFNFDPNTVSVSDLLKLGLSKRQAQTLVKYRKAGGKFKRKEDVKKIYTIDNKLYNKLKPFIKIPEPKESVEVLKKTTEIDKIENEDDYAEKTEPIIVELNTADSTDLIKLFGIGPVLARRIINYRSFLGGFYKKKQLMEVYGLKKDTYKLISDFVSIDSSYIQKMNINTIEFKTLNKHPYVTYLHTKSILKYRKLMGGFTSVESVLENHLMDSISYNKIKYYITVE